YAFSWTVETGAYHVWAEAVDDEGGRNRSSNYAVQVDYINQAPTITFNSPTDGTVLADSSDVAIALAVSDADGTVALVQIYVDGVLLAEDSAAPYEATWSSPTEGPHTISVTATDERGDSAEASISVGVPFTGGDPLVREAEDAILVGDFVVLDDESASGGQVVEAVSGPADTNYAEFRFNLPSAGIYALRTMVNTRFIDGRHDSMFVSIDGASPTQHTWFVEQSETIIEDYVRSGEMDPLELDLDAGPHFVRFGYRENLVLDLVELEFLRDRPDNYLPSVGLTAPAAGEVFTTGATISLAAEASDPDGSVAKVEFFNGATKLGEDSEAPYTYEWTGAPSGILALTAVVTDDAGAAVTSDPVEISVFYANGALTQEAETAAGQVGAVTVVADAAASGGEYVSFPAPAGEEIRSAATDYLEFQVNVTEADVYNLWISYRAPDEASNAIHLSVDEGAADQYLWEMPVSTTFTSGIVTLAGEAEPLVLDLGVGGHTIRLGYSEPVDIDRLELRVDPGDGFKSGRTYQFVNVGSGMVLEINGRGVRQGLNESLDTQAWTIEEIREDVYSIRVQNNSEGLDHYINDDEVGTWTFSASKNNQLWTIDVVEEGVFTFAALSMPANNVLGPDGFSDADEANVSFAEYVGDPHQHWNLVEPGAVAERAHTVYLLGDSTVSNYSSSFYPQTGWGQVLQPFFDEEVEIKNVALGGRSAKSYYNDHWAPVRDDLEPGDFVFIGFGINDANRNDPARYSEASTTYKAYLTSFVTETRAAGAYPVIVSTVRRNAWNGTDPDTLYNAYHGYPVASRELAGELGVPLIDLDQLTVPLLEGLGPAYVGPFMYLVLESGEYPSGNYAEGATDNVHFQEMGAIEMARLVVDGIELLAADPQVGDLVEWIHPVNEVTVSANLPDAGLVTHTASYPAGLDVTLKAVPDAGYTFERWETADGEVATTSHLLTFEMGTSPRRFTAIFAAGSPGE
ncbi:MAG: Ig-like domain-containing protein, partial [Opitutales bacterium]